LAAILNKATVYLGHTQTRMRTWPFCTEAYLWGPCAWAFLWGWNFL